MRMQLILSENNKADDINNVSIANAILKFIRESNQHSVMNYQLGDEHKILDATTIANILLAQSTFENRIIKNTTDIGETL